MVAIRDDNPVKIVPYITYGLIAINILVFGYELSLGENILSFFHTWAIVPKELTATFTGAALSRDIPEWLTLVTSQFLHAGFLHVAGNMLFLWVFGNNVEEELGHFKFLGFYLACGVLASLTQWFFSADSIVPSLGASGAIAGVMGAYILRFPKAEILTVIPLGLFYPTIRVPAFYFLGFWFLQQSFYGIASLNVPTNVGMAGGGVAYWAHAGGFVFGAVLGSLLGLFSSQKNEKGQEIQEV